jgi:ATP-dependent Clp protease ATP-binding subunit ClpA
VVEKFILELEMQLEDRGVHIKLSKEAKSFIAKKGYDKHFGARPLKRVISEEIKKPLANELLFGRLVEGGEVKVGFKNKELTIDIEPGKVAPKPKRKKKKKETVNK